MHATKYFSVVHLHHHILIKEFLMGYIIIVEVSTITQFFNTSTNYVHLCVSNVPYKRWAMSWVLCLDDIKWKMVIESLHLFIIHEVS